MQHMQFHNEVEKGRHVIIFLYEGTTFQNCVTIFQSLPDFVSFPREYSLVFWNCTSNIEIHFLVFSQGFPLRIHQKMMMLMFFFNASTFSIIPSACHLLGTYPTCIDIVKAENTD